MKVWPSSGPTSPSTTIRASAQFVPPTNRPCSNRPGPPRWPAPGTRTGQAGTACPRRRSTPSAAAVRSGRPGPSRASSTGVPSDATYSVISAATSGAGGLDTSTTSSTDSSASSRRSASRVARPPTSADRSRPPTPRAEETPTPAWSSSASSCWQPVPDAATMPTGPGCTTLAKPRPRPPTTAVPQSGPITSSPRVGASRLRATSCSSGTLSLNSITSQPASRASIASTVALAPGVETSTRPPGVARSAAAVVRAGAVSEAPAGRRAVVVSARSTAANPRASASASVGADRDHHVVDAGGRYGEPHPAQHVDVQRGGHRDLGGEHAVDLRHVAAHLEQGHRVGVGARAELDVGRGAHAAAVRSVRVARAWRAPHHRPEPGGVADRGAGPARRRPRQECRAPRGTSRAPAAPPRAGHSRAASPRASWCGGACRAPP